MNICNNQNLHYLEYFMNGKRVGLFDWEIGLSNIRSHQYLLIDEPPINRDKVTEVLYSDFKDTFESGGTLKYSDLINEMFKCKPIKLQLWK